jgi:hypothetical protein
MPKAVPENRREQYAKVALGGCEFRCRVDRVSDASVCRGEPLVGMRSDANDPVAAIWLDDAGTVLLITRAPDNLVESPHHCARMRHAALALRLLPTLIDRVQVRVGDRLAVHSAE